MKKLTRQFFVEKGREGGKKRTAKLSAEQRSELARRAAQARWQQKKRGTSK